MKKNEFLNLSRITLTLSLLIGALMLPGWTGEIHAADDCKAACDLYVKCTGEIVGRAPTASEANTLNQGCMKTCNEKKHQKGILMCYAESKKADNTCKTYYACVSSHAQK